MKHILLGLFLSLTFGLSGQLAISPTPIDINSLASEVDIPVYYTVANTDGNAIDFLWRLSDSSEFPSDWQVHICDMNFCYFHTIHECPSNAPNEMTAGGSHVFELHVNPHGQEAEYTFLFEVYSAADPSTIIDEVTITVSTLSSSTSDVVSADFALYPNPTLESFQINNDDNVSSVAIYNIVGKQIKTYNHQTGNIYNVSSLKKGMYLVRLFNDEGDTMRSLRLSKK